MLDHETVPAPNLLVVLAVLCAFSLASRASLASSGDESIFLDGAEPLILRLTRIDLRDPHVFGLLIFPTCVDSTTELNDWTLTNLNTDAGADGVLDASPVVLLAPFEAGEDGRLWHGNARCSAPTSETSCQPRGNFSGRAFLAGTGVCRDVVPGTTSFYDPPILVPMEPCLDDGRDYRLVDIGGITIPLHEVALTLPTDQAGSGISQVGLLQGFLTQSDAAGVIVPDNISFIGGFPLDQVLGGGTGSCSSYGGTDPDKHPTLGLGWYLYFEVDAEIVPPAL